MYITLALCYYPSNVLALLDIARSRVARLEHSSILIDRQHADLTACHQSSRMHCVIDHLHIGAILLEVCPARSSLGRADRHLATNADYWPQCPSSSRDSQRCVARRCGVLIECQGSHALISMLLLCSVPARASGFLKRSDTNRGYVLEPLICSGILHFVVYTDFIMFNLLAGFSSYIRFFPRMRQVIVNNVPTSSTRSSWSL